MSSAHGALPAWALPADEVLRRLSVEEQKGLTEQDVEQRRAEYGFNELEASVLAAAIRVAIC